MNKSRQQLMLSAIAGSVFGLAGLVSNACFNLSSEIVVGIIDLITHNYENGYDLFPWFYFSIQGIIAGGAAGAALGYVQSYFSAVRIVEKKLG